MNLRPSGYETYAVRPTGVYGLIEFVRLPLYLEKGDDAHPDQANVL